MKKINLLGTTLMMITIPIAVSITTVAVSAEDSEDSYSKFTNEKSTNLDLGTDKSKDIIYCNHSTQLHTKSEIKQKYEESVSYDYSNNIYKITPISKTSYAPGELQEGVVNDALNRLNFYRWMYGVNEVKLNNDKMERNQKGAVLLKANNKLTHSPTKPEDMPEDFYNEGYLACSVNNKPGDTYSGNCSKDNADIYKCIDGYISDIYNKSTDNGAVGHRMSLLYPYAKQTSFGQCYPYTTLSMYYEFEDTKSELKENYYAFPSAGYFPSEQFITNEYWSIYFTEELVKNDNFSVKFIYNGNTYDATGIVDEHYYSALDFRLPDELVNKLGGSNFNMPEVEIEVLITGLTNLKGDNISYNYKVNFFSLYNDDLLTDNAIQIAKQNTNNEQLKLSVIHLNRKQEK